jgi:GNAT superfamily N-acetyltransferase
VITHACEECGSVVEGADAEAFGDAFIAHARADHPDWPFPDMAIRNYAAATQRLSDRTKRLDEIGSVQIHPVTEERMADWLAFFDRDGFAGNPAWASCYCLEPFLLDPNAPEPDALNTSWQERRALAVTYFQGGRAYGYLAYVDGTAAGWVNASRRGEQALYRRTDAGAPAAGGPADAPTDGETVALSCFLIAPPYRGHGIAARLLERVLADAPGRGIRAVEAYPFHEGRQNAFGPDFHGSPAMFAAAGFEPVEKRERYTVVRKTL